MRPLNDQTAWYIPRKRRLGGTKSLISADFKKPFNEKWPTTCEYVFKTLIQKLTTAPILGFADPKQPYIVQTDASLQGLGAAIYQEQEGKLRVITYTSNIYACALYMHVRCQKCLSKIGHENKGKIQSKAE